MGTVEGSRPGARRDLYSRYRRSLLPPERVRELSRRRPRRVIRDTTICWAIVLAAWFGAAAIGTWWALAVAVVLVGTRFYALFIIGHDGLHRRLFDTTARNDLFADLLVFGPIVAITRINNRNHLLHHQYLGSEDDPDRHKHACFNKATRPQLASYLTGASSIVTSARHVFVRNANGRRSEGNAKSADTKRRYNLRDIAILVSWQAALIALLSWLFGWWGYLVLWWLPIFVFVVLGDNLRTFAEHSHPQSDADADQHRLVTNTPGWLERQFLSPMNMNYHAAHHLWPSIPYYNLPAADAEMRKAADADLITWRGSYLAYLWRYYRALPLAECKPAVVASA
jgi:fatty acid desaturase